jgi:hypothetical protein
MRSSTLLFQIFRSKKWQIMPTIGLFLIFSNAPNSVFCQTALPDAGLRFEQKKGETYPIVGQVFHFSSAEEAEIKAGDIVWQLDGASTEGLKPAEVLARLGGKEGDKHTLQIGADKRKVKVKLKVLKGKCASGGCKTGRGVWQDPDATYEGDFVLGKYEGKGIMTYLSGNRHEGSYRAGKRDGDGKYFFSTGTVYDGNFENNNFNGIGKLKYKTGETFEGEFVDDERNGTGIGTWPNGDKYDGTWISDLRDGQGAMTYADGSRYDGAWSKGQRQGFGRMTSFEGWSYEGNWNADQRDGFGKMRTSNGDRIEGLFSGDNLPVGMEKYANLVANVDPAKTTASVSNQTYYEEKPSFQGKSSQNNAASTPFVVPARVVIFAGSLRPTDSKSAAKRKFPVNKKDDGVKIRLAKILDGFYDNAGAADTWLVDNERIANRKERKENLNGLGIMTATWAASAKNNLEAFAKDVKGSNAPEISRSCDDFLTTNAQMAEKYQNLSSLINEQVSGLGDRMYEIGILQDDIRSLWATHEQQFEAARKMLF